MTATELKDLLINNSFPSVVMAFQGSYKYALTYVGEYEGREFKAVVTDYRWGFGPTLDTSHLDVIDEVYMFCWIGEEDNGISWSNV